MTNSHQWKTHNPHVNTTPPACLHLFMRIDYTVFPIRPAPAKRATMKRAHKIAH